VITLEETIFTLIDKSVSIQAGRYYPCLDRDILEEERKNIFECIQERPFRTIEEEWAFRNGFIARKYYGKPYIIVLRKECILLCNYKCQGNEQGKYHVGYDDDLGDEETSIINYKLSNFNYKTQEETYAFKKGFIARRKFGTRYLEFQNRYGRFNYNELNNDSN
jgi:hypothetical protein